MRSRQTGVTFIGWLLLLTPVAIVGYAGVRLLPLYLNYFNVVKAITQTAAEYNSENQVNVDAARRAIDRRLDIDGVTYPTSKDIVIKRDGSAWTFVADYEDGAPLFADISLVVHFSKTILVE